jgi:hypothetical protein
MALSKARVSLDKSVFDRLVKLSTLSLPNNEGEIIKVLCETHRVLSHTLASMPLPANRKYSQSLSGSRLLVVR